MHGVTRFDTAALDRMSASLIASWRWLASREPGAAVRRVGEADAAIFPHGPAREILNNALLARGAADVPGSLRALERVYADARVPGFAVWAHESDAAAQRACERAGYRTHEAPRGMVARLDGLDGAAGGRGAVGAGGGGAPDAAAGGPGAAGATGTGGDAGAAADGAPVEAGEAAEALVVNGLTPDLLTAWPGDGRWYVVRDGGRAIAAALAQDHEDDCIVSFVATLPEARRRGHAGRIIARLLADAAARGRTTATLRSTPVAERLYAAAGFRDLGRFVEWEPPERWAG